jgi:nicotinamide-nucleotide amidase
MAETLNPILPPEVEDCARRVLDQAHDKGFKLATAESCTGGLLAALLTDVRGRGHVFDRGFVTYSVAAKCDLLGLNRQEVESCRGVSKQVAVEMARGALRRSDADLALAITGFAGPGAPDDEEGLVHLACARKGNGNCHHREEHFGNIGRDGVRIAALGVALDMIGAAFDA